MIFWPVKQMLVNLNHLPLQRKVINTYPTKMVFH